MMHSTKKLAAKLHNESARAAAYSSTLRIHGETIAKALRLVFQSLYGSKFMVLLT